ncbi:craniofacial development protein 2-like [Elysia marginata]|uniref:Craniofacial development protein 2-like n=1 Tax=Elysia marginata TaxID=1093978 RepID=A0AAV4EHJ2_9GAST|nr:craniofacial development protein 2-like [Elysia marginata]
MSKALKYYSTFSERIISAKFTKQHHDTLLIQAYAPTTDHGKEEIEQFYDDLSEIIRRNKPCKDKLWSSANSTLKSARKERKESSVLLDLVLEFCKKRHLFVVYTWIEQKESARHT